MDLFPPEQIARLRAPLERSWTLPPAAYTEPAVFREEAARIFRREWLCVARVDQLPNPGDYRCVELLDQRIVLTRDRHGRIHALSRICLHRAMPLVEGCGNATRLVCPYHNWTYELDGRLRSAPMMDGVDGFEPGACRLPALRTEIWEGFVFVNLDPECRPLVPRLTGLQARIGNYRFADLAVAATTEFDSPWNWKILVENFMEAYHHIGPHRESLQRLYPARDSFVEDNKGAPWALLRMPGRHEPGPQALRPLPGLTPEQQRELIAGCIFPTFLFAASGTLAVWYELLPAAHDRMTLRIHLLLPREIVPHLDDHARAALTESTRAIHLEDIPANTGPWRGLHAPLTTQGRLSRYEKAIWQLNQLWAERMLDPPDSGGWKNDPAGGTTSRETFF
ncbi:MAG TPA: aromatic ring-hydroxylating dioxygenase subunit alpha [Pseudomonadales bacterium]